MGLLWLNGSGLGSLRRLLSGMGQGWSHLKAWLGVEGPLLSWPLTWLEVLTIDRRPHYPSSKPPHRLLECLLGIVLVSPEQVIQETEVQATISFMKSPWTLHTIISAIFYGPHKPALSQCKRLHKSLMLEAKHPCRGGIVSQKVATTIKCHGCAHNFLIIRRRHIKM